MASLRELVGSGEKRQALIKDAVAVLDAEVEDKSGFGGMAVKTAYKVVKGVKPGFVTEAVDYLLDDFLDALDPIYQEALQKGTTPREQLLSNTSRAADALLATTDSRAQRAKSPTLKRTYDKLRPSAKHHVETAMPRVGDLFDKHVPAGG